MATSIVRVRTLGAEPWPIDADSGSASPVAECEHDVARLYCEEAPRLRRMFARRLSPERAADLVQTAFARLMGLGPVRRSALDQPQAYLTRIAGNLLRDEARFSARRSDALHVSAEECVLATADPHAMLEARDMLRRVDAAIEGLPERTREIFMAHRFEELTYPQIAERSGISIKTVEKHISLALRQLHRALEPRA
jgi:RNA polymerase sigma-70 factor (ECF subfamily)